MPSESLNLKELFARAYSQAALADANMREATGALEIVHDRLNSGLGYHDVLSGIDEQIGQVDLVRLVPALQELRRSYTRWVVESETRRLKDAYSKDATSGWLAWLTAYAQNFQETAWRTELGRQLADALTATPDPNWPVSRVQRNVWLICRERWPEAYNWVIYLTEQDIPPEFRARMLAIAAEIQLYRFIQPTKADALLKRAERVEPGEHVTARACAAVSFEGKEIDDAKRRYQAIIEKRPRLCDGYLGLAECADAEGDAAAAEAFYVQAIRSAPGMTSGQRGLMNWYAKRFNERESLIMPIFSRMLAMNDDEAGECLNLGLLFKNAGRVQTARDWITKAITLQPDNGLAEVWAGHMDRDEAAGEQTNAEALRASAEVHFTNDIRICPEGMDGLWGMMCIGLDRHDWSAARTWCDRVLAIHPEWESSLLVRRATISMETSEWSKAEEDLRRSMSLEPNNPGAIDAMLDLADKIGTTDMDKAVGVLAEWRKHKPDSVEYLYQNRLGNWEYGRGNYKLAADHYGLAVQANPSGPVLRSNLALAAAAMRTSGNRHECLTRAIDSLTHAVRLDAKESQYRERLGRLTTERDFIDVYGEKALELNAIVTPLRIEVPNEALPAILETELRALSTETLDHVNTWRTAFRARMGMHLPGVNFTVAEGLERPDRFRMVIMERDERVGTLNGGLPIDDMLGQLEAFCLEHLTVFVGHQEAFNLLIGLKNDDMTTVVETPGLLTKFVFVLQELVSQAIPITDLASITSTFVAEQRSGVSLTKIALRLATAATARSVEKR